MKVLRAIRGARLARLARAEAAFYGEIRWSRPGAIESWQLERLNANWCDWSARVPWFRNGVRTGRFPARFDSLAHFRSDAPTMDKALVQSAGAALRDPRHAANEWRATGGTTSEPVRFPVWGGEVTAAAARLWYARTWYGIEPQDRLFMIWGHSHQFGVGLGGQVRRRVRDLKDRLLGYRRWSAYRIGDADLQRAAEEMIEFRPRYVLGYSMALARFARANARRAAALQALLLKAVIATGEGFRTVQDRDAVRAVFGAPLTMEYGAVETGPIAHEAPDGLLHVFWHNYFVEAFPFTEMPGAGELLVTSLSPRALPLCRYRMGDLVQGAADEVGLTQMAAVIGRCNDAIRVADGQVVHSEAFTHVLRDSDVVTAFQVLQDVTGRVTIRFESARSLAPAEEGELRRRFALVHRALRAVELQRVDRLPTTIAGKTRTIVSQWTSTESR